MNTPRLPGIAQDGMWHAVRRTDRRAVALADRHYSRQTPGAPEFLNSGQTLTLLTDDGLSLWGVLHNRDPWAMVNEGVERWRWRCAIFRNEPPPGRDRPAIESSLLVREATWRTFEWWARHYGAVPSVPLTTEVDPSKTRRKRDPGRCFLRAGWTRTGVVDGLVVLQSPPEAVVRAPEYWSPAMVGA